MKAPLQEEARHKTVTEDDLLTLRKKKKELPSANLRPPCQGVWRSEVHVRCLRIRLDSQSVVCVHSGGLGSSLLVLVVLLTDSRGSTLFIFCTYHLPKR
jgi:hypothetical protein